MHAVCLCFCRTVFILSEALDEQLKTLWFSPFQTDDMETDLDMVRAYTLQVKSLDTPYAFNFLH